MYPEYPECGYLRLERRDPEKHMARFYVLHIVPTLFGGWDLIREWGRIDSPGTLRSDPFVTREEAERSSLRIERRKRRRGYGLVSGSPA